MQQQSLELDQLWMQLLEECAKRKIKPERIIHRRTYGPTEREVLLDDGPTRAARKAVGLYLVRSGWTQLEVASVMGMSVRQVRAWAKDMPTSLLASLGQGRSRMSLNNSIETKRERANDIFDGEIGSWYL